MMRIVVTLLLFVAARWGAAQERAPRDPQVAAENVAAEKIAAMEKIADLALIPPALNTAPLPKYDYDQLDYGMTIGIERTPGGRLWACWVAGGDSPKAFFVLATSDDDGETWSKPRLVVDAHAADLPAERSVLVGNLWTDPLGRLWLIFDQSMDMFDGRAGVWAAVCEDPDAERPLWSKPRRIWHGVTLNKPTVLSSGEWMLPISLDQRPGFRQFKGCFRELDPLRGANVFVSSDKGETWGRRGCVLFPDPDWHEHMIVERRDGSLWMLARTARGIMESSSADQGKTWIAPSASSIKHPVARFHIRRLDSGRILLIKHGRTIDTHDGRSMLTAWLSPDDGKTWQGGLMLDERRGVSYPDGFQAPDGVIYISYDRNRATDGEILLARFTESDVLAGKLEGQKSKLKMLISRPLGRAAPRAGKVDSKVDGDADGDADGEIKERFGEQEFSPKGGYLLRPGQRLPELVWEQPELVGRVIGDLRIPTRWFNERFESVEAAGEPGRYFAYGEAPAPSGPTVRRAMTCCCVAEGVELAELAAQRIAAEGAAEGAEDPERRRVEIDALVRRWRTSPEGAVELAALLDKQRPAGAVRRGQWQMEDATRHVRLKRKLMGWDDKPPVKAVPQASAGPPAPELRSGPLAETGIAESQVREIESQLDAWHASSGEPMAVVIAQNGVIVLAKGYGTLRGEPVTVNTPMSLDSAMKPLIGLQLAMYVDQGILRLDEPLGNYLPDFNSPQDRHLTFRAGHVHVTGIHFPWDLAFWRLFYFHTWHESLIAHCRREWAPGARHRYGVVGIILSVRALELLRGRNYWDAMERDLFEPLGIRDVLPGGRGFSAESLARIGVLLDNRGMYGKWRVISEETHRAILPAPLKPHFPQLDMDYGIGLKDESQHLGPGSYGHGGGCGTLLAINPQKRLVVAMVRNAQGPEFKERRAEFTATLKTWRPNGAPPQR